MIRLCVKLLHAPLAMVVHAVEAVPLSVELCEGVSDLGDLSGRSILDDIRLPLMDPCDLLTNTLQTLLDILLKDKIQYEHKGKTW